jgi:hypothetical protein
MKKLLTNLKNKIYNYANTNSDSVIIVTIMATLSFISGINSAIENNMNIVIADFIGEYVFETIFYILMYLYILHFLKNKNVNFVLKNVTAVLSISALWSLIEVNLRLLNNDIPTNQYSIILLETFIKESFDIAIFIFSALIVQYAINKFIINNLYRQQAGFIGKIPASERENIYLIKSKENYIDVYYGKNNEHKLINYRFSTALKEMPIDKGMQIHRSFWISNELIKTLKRIDGKYYVNVKGELVPVSKTYLKQIKAIKEEL